MRRYSIKSLPPDLVFVTFYVLIADLVVLTPAFDQTIIRVLLGLPLLLILPGYTFIAALFPENERALNVTQKSDYQDDSFVIPYRRGIDLSERLALSFGMSIVIVSLIGLTVNILNYQFDSHSTALSLSSFILIMVVIGTYRRLALVEDERFQLFNPEDIMSLFTSTFENKRRAELLLNVILLFSVVLAASTVGYAILFPQNAESFTSLYLLTKNDQNNVSADNYPKDFDFGQSRPIIVSVENHEQSPTQYFLSIRLQHVEVRDGRMNVLRDEEIQNIQTPVLGVNESWQRNVSITPNFPGHNLRLIFLLYKQELPANPTSTNAYREVHIWINVTSR